MCSDDNAATSDAAISSSYIPPFIIIVVVNHHRYRHPRLSITPLDSSTDGRATGTSVRRRPIIVAGIQIWREDSVSTTNHGRPCRGPTSDIRTAPVPVLSPISPPIDYHIPESQSPSPPSQCPVHFSGNDPAEQRTGETGQLVQQGAAPSEMQCLRQPSLIEHCSAYCIACTTIKGPHQPSWISIRP